MWRGDAAGGSSVEEDAFGGGFGSLHSMLQWAIGTGIPNPLNSAVRSFDFFGNLKFCRKRSGQLIIDVAFVFVEFGWV